MDTTDSLETQVMMAEQTRLLLEHPALIRSFEHLEAKYLAEWHMSDATDVSALQTIKFKQAALTAFRHDLETALTSGRFAARNSGASRAPMKKMNLNRNV